MKTKFPTLGMAYASGKPVTIISPSRSKVAQSVTGMQVISSGMSNKEAISFALDLIIARKSFQKSRKRFKISAESGAMLLILANWPSGSLILSIALHRK